jgi:hypothetical protein
MCPGKGLGIRGWGLGKDGPSARIIFSRDHTKQQICWPPQAAIHP